MKKYYFTFGCGQQYENCYTVIEAEGPEEAREMMFNTFGTQWSMQYDSSEAAGVEEFRLRYIERAADWYQHEKEKLDKVWLLFSNKMRIKLFKQLDSGWRGWESMTEERVIGEIEEQLADTPVDAIDIALLAMFLGEAQ